MLKQLLEKEEGRLAEYWRKWEECQGEYVDLGVEVFGAEAFGEDGKGGKEKGWKKEGELREAEHEARVGEVEEEVGEIRRVFLKEMKSSEKVSGVAVVGFVMKLTLGFSIWISRRGKSRRGFCKPLSRTNGMWEIEVMMLSSVVLHSDFIIHGRRSDIHICSVGCLYQRSITRVSIIS